MWEVIIANAKAVVPKALDSALRISGAKLLGKVLAIPEAWADGKIQGIKDKAEAKSIVSRALAEAAAKGLVENKDTVEAFGQSLIEEYQQKISNRADVFLKAVEHLADGTIASDENASPPDDDWLNSFRRISEDASSERLQDLLARILAGEISRRGTYSISTLRIIGELDKETADTFSEVYSESFDSLHVHRSPKYVRSPWWNKINSLRDAGFISAADGSIHHPSISPQAANGIGYWNVGHQPSLLIAFKLEGQNEIPVYTLTRMGVEIGSLLPSPPFEQNLRTLAATNPYKAGWVSVHLIKDGSDSELIFSK